MPEAFTSRTLRELTRIIFSHLLAMILIVILLTGGTFLACKKADPIYESSVTVLVKQPKTASSKVKEVSPDRSLEVFIKTQHQLIMSDLVLSRTMALLDDSALRNRWQAAIDALAKAQAPSRDNERSAITKLVAEIDKPALEIVTTRQRDLRRFRKKVDVQTPGGATVGLSEVFTITVRQKDSPQFAPGQQAHTAAKLLAACYVDRYAEVQAENFRDASVLVKERVDGLRDTTLDTAEKALDNFLAKELGGTQASAKPSSPSTQAASGLKPADVVILEQLLKSGTEAGAQITRRRFEEERIRLSTELASAQALQQLLSEELADERLTTVLTKKNVDGLEVRALNLFKPVPDTKGDMKRLKDLEAVAAELFALTEEPRIIVPQQVLTNNDIVNKMKRTLADLVIARNKMRGQFSSTYRELVNLYIEIARAKLEVIIELKAEQKALDVQIKTIRARQDQVAEQIALITRKLDSLARLLPVYDRLQSDLRAARTNYATMQTELLQAQADEQRARKDTTIQVIDAAGTPDPERPVIPNTPVYSVVALAVSILLAFAFAFLSDHFDHTLRSIQEVERYLGTSVLGSLPKRGGRIVL